MAYALSLPLMAPRFAASTPTTVTPKNSFVAAATRTAFSGGADVATTDSVVTSDHSALIKNLGMGLSTVAETQEGWNKQATNFLKSVHELVSAGQINDWEHRYLSGAFQQACQEAAGKDYSLTLRKLNIPYGYVPQGITTHYKEIIFLKNSESQNQCHLPNQKNNTFDDNCVFNGKAVFTGDCTNMKTGDFGTPRYCAGADLSRANLAGSDIYLSGHIQF
ncbi:MAG: hypothetical protein U0003_05375 [Vampirovibrionales bacterium]